MTDERAIEDRIRARAHEIWEREGRPEGAAARHWDEARLEIEAEERVARATTPEPEPESPAMLADPAGERAAAPDLPPEAGRGAEQPVETEASPSQLDRAPI
ncbi:MAG: hypothetical protein DI556_07220 [Rhodovulum sulfidophilum]|uniref:DUF2934 domain-containing protein n=1 Tax=Rhodovulum sulfidophilum TaxID=35806 RepID=A0A2W5NA22_RHOSU|nr:MAG: hypothetical protein DI556_07220 [Rhodovulum sulfidophilum]